MDFISTWKADSDEALHPVTSTQVEATLQELLRSPAWHDRRRQDAAQRTHTWHEIEALDDETAQRWFAATFHLLWLCRQDPTNVGAWIRLGRACAEQGRWAESARAFKTAIRLSPHDTDLSYSDALADLAGNDPAAFTGDLADFTAWVEKSPKVGDSNAAAWLAAISAAKEIDRPRFLALARKAVASDGNSRYYHALLGASLYRSGNFQEAVDELLTNVVWPKEESQKPALVVGRATQGHAAERRKPEPVEGRLQLCRAQPFSRWRIITWRTFRGRRWIARSSNSLRTPFSRHSVVPRRSRSRSARPQAAWRGYDSHRS